VADRAGQLDVAHALAAHLRLVTSTPHLSQITPRCFMRLYLPHRHSQSVIGPKILAQNKPSRSGLKVGS
jgi:hypothetical protein